MNYSWYSMQELNRIANEDDEALMEYGRRALKTDIYEEGDDHWCSYRDELEHIQNDVYSEIPPECPHCGKYIE